MNSYYGIKKLGSYCIGLIILMSMLWLSACNQTPLQKLSSDHRYPELSIAYWSKEQSNKTTLWEEAASYCKQHTEKPNCSTVMELYVITNGSTQAPAIGHSGHTLHVP